MLTGPELLPEHREREYSPTVRLAVFLNQALSQDRSCQRAVEGWIAQCVAEGPRPPELAHGWLQQSARAAGDTDGHGVHSRGRGVALRSVAGGLALEGPGGEDRRRHRALDPGSLCTNVTWNTCLLEFAVQGRITHGSSTGFFDEPRSVHSQSGHPGRSPQGE